MHSGCALTAAGGCDQGRLEDYDPRRTDVWAAGVMLVVTLLGAFPFDHTANHTAGTTDDELDLWWGPAFVWCCLRHQIALPWPTTCRLAMDGLMPS